MIQNSLINNFKIFSILLEYFQIIIICFIKLNKKISNFKPFLLKLNTYKIIEFANEYYLIIMIPLRYGKWYL